jgi:Mycothiol maleylpyruvate isomerase N-terminal domain
MRPHDTGWQASSTRLQWIRRIANAAEGQRTARKGVRLMPDSENTSRSSSEGQAREGAAILAAIDEVEPDAPTACAGWTAHDIAAHLAAGSKEVADLVEERLEGRPERATRPFDEREAPFRAMPHRELRDRLIAENKRKLAGYEALAREAVPAITFTGTRLTVDELAMHSRSEAALHRWDLVGDDQTSDELLAQYELTVHAVKVLDAMPVLNESARALGERATRTGARSLRVVFRSLPQPDVVFVVSAGEGRFQLADNANSAGDAILTMDPVQRLLALWGRRSANREVTTEGDPDVVSALTEVFWPNAQPWPQISTVDP